jgi:hypothetical protein
MNSLSITLEKANWHIHIECELIRDGMKYLISASKNPLTGAISASCRKGNGSAFDFHGSKADTFLYAIPHLIADCLPNFEKRRFLLAINDAAQDNDSVDFGVMNPSQVKIDNYLRIFNEIWTNQRIIERC